MTEFFQDAHEQDQDRAVSLLAKDQYLRELRWLPFADRDQQAIWVERIKRGLFERKQLVPDQWRLHLAKHARGLLVESYQAVIASFATSFARCCTGYEIGDFVSEGTLGLLQFLDRLDAYEELTGAAFHTLALSYIRGEMLDALRYRTGMVRLPQKALMQVKQIEHLEQEMLQTCGREPTVHEIAHRLQVSVAKAFELLEYRRRRQVESLEGLLEESDVHECLNFVSAFAAQVQADEQRSTDMREAIDTALATLLTEQEQAVIRLRYGFGERVGAVRSYNEVGKALHIAESTSYKVDCRARKQLGQVLPSRFVRSGVPEAEAVCSEGQRSA